MTLMDRVKKFNKKYISETKAISNPPKDTMGFQSSDQMTGIEMGDKGAQGKYSIDNLNPVLRRKKAFTAALYIKGLNKKSKDTFRAWFELEKYRTRGKLSVLDETLIRLFNKRSNIKSKFTIGDKCSHIYGDGFILITYDNDNVAGKNGVVDVSLPPTRNAKPSNLVVLDPELFKEVKPKDETWKKRKVEHFFFEYRDGTEVYVHPDRMLHIPRNKLPFSKVGVGDIDILVDIINSYSDINISTGEILKWFAHGLVTVKKNNMSPNERADIEKQLALHNNIIMSDDRYDFNVIKPDAINPQPFYEFVIQNIAGVLGMPAHMLTGVVIGKVTGAETAYSDYYRDVADDQEILYTALFEKLYTQLLRSHNSREFKYNIAWNQIYINESAEADLIGKRANAANLLKGGGIIDNKEAREIVNKGLVELDLNKIIKQDNPPTQNKPLPLDRLIRPGKNPKKKEKINSDVIKYGRKQA
jgi:hypothetical protein